MSIKKLMESEIEKDNSIHEHDKAAVLSSKRHYENLVDEQLRITERYYQKHLLPVLVEANSTMGGKGPNPDGSLPWRGGKNWTCDPIKNIEPSFEDYRPNSVITVKIIGKVVWDIEKWKSGRGSYTDIEWGVVCLEVDNTGKVTSVNKRNNDDKNVVDLNKDGSKLKLERMIVDCIRSLRDRNGTPYKLGGRSVEIPDWLVRDHNTEKNLLSKKTYTNVVLPILRNIASQKGIDLSKNPFKKYSFFGKPEYNTENVPVTPGLVESCESYYYKGALVIRVVSSKESDPVLAIGIRLTAELETVLVETGKYKYEKFNVSNNEGVNKLIKFVDNQVRSQSMIEFYHPVVDYQSP